MKLSTADLRTDRHWRSAIGLDMPKTHFDNAESFKAYFKDKGPVLIDATEQRTQRPQESTYQKQMYSGKKKAILLKP